MKKLFTISPAAQKGATLLEVMVAVIVLSVGLLGLLGLLMHGLKMSSSSHYRTIAAQQLADMTEKINSNPYFVSEYAPPTNTLTSNCLTTTKCSADATLTPNLIANSEYALWLANARLRLPGGSGTVCLDSSPADGNSSDFACSNSGRITIKVCWNESRRIAVSGGGVSNSDSSTDTCLSTQI